MFSLRALFFAACLLLVVLGMPAVALSETGVPDLEDVGGDVDLLDVGNGDAGDVGNGDIGDVHVEDDIGASDVHVEIDTGSGDVHVDDTGVVEPPRDVRFSGRVWLQNAVNFVGVNIHARHVESGQEITTSTALEGHFEFPPLKPGAYEITLTHPGFVTMVEVLELSGDLSREYHLFLSQNVPLAVEVVFGSASPNAVEFSLDGERGKIGPETIAVVDGAARWAVAELPVGVWTLTASSRLHEDVSYRFSAVHNRPLSVRLILPPPRPTPDATVTESCGCQTMAVPVPRAGIWMLALLFIGLAWRRRR